MNMASTSSSAMMSMRTFESPINSFLLTTVSYPWFSEIDNLHAQQLGGFGITDQVFRYHVKNQLSEKTGPLGWVTPPRFGLYPFLDTEIFPHLAGC